MISTADAEKMVAEKMAREAQSAQTEEKQEDIKQPDTPDPSTEKPDDKKPEETKPEETKADDTKAEDDKAKPEDKPDEDKDKPEDENKDKRPPKQKYSHEERIAHKFAKEKQRRKADREKYEARIKELEDQLEREKGLKLEDFNNNTPDYMDYKLRERDKQNEVQNLKQRIEQDDAEAMRQETERRIELSFPDENDRAEYERLIETRGGEFYDALQKYDTENTVLKYLNGLDKYPIVLQKLMTDNDALATVFRNKDPEEMRYQLRKLTEELLSPKAKAAPVEKKQEQPPAAKPALPVIGKQVTANGKPSEPVHDRAYWNEYLRQHPHG